MRRKKKTGAMVECSEPGCNRLVFKGQGKCWEHKLKDRDARIKRITGRM